MKSNVSKHDTVIVGGGLFGRTIGAALRARGEDVVILDKGEGHSGLSCAACLMKPSWMTKMSKEQQRESLDILDELFGLQKVNFKLAPSFVHEELYWVDPNHIRQVEVTTGMAETIARRRVVTADGKEYLGRVLKCMGGWDEEVCRPKWGAAYLKKGTTEAVIRPWRPYTQLVKFSMNNELIWAGDGTAVFNWNDKYSKDTRHRVQSFVGEERMECRLGMRPYVQSLKTPAMIVTDRPHQPWSVTGGAKNGTIGAGWAANLLSSLTAKQVEDM